MSRSLRCIPALGAVLFAVAGLSACGGIPGNAVLQVDGKPLTKATFNHWMGVAAAATATSTGQLVAMASCFQSLFIQLG